MKRWDGLKNRNIEIFALDWDMMNAEDKYGKNFGIFRFKMGDPEKSDPKLKQWGERYMKYGSLQRIRMDIVRELYNKVVDEYKI